MKRFAAAVLAILGMAVSSIGAAQSVKFAIGQTWTGTFQGFGTWTAKFTELDDEGDPRGITSAGPDERTAGGFDSNGRSAFYTIKNGDGVICYANSATAQNGVYSGAITRQQGNAAAQKLGTPCTFSQVTAASSQSGAAVWPPSAGLSAGATLRLEGRQVWTLSFTGKDSDGDWTGKATGADGKTATLFSYLQDDGSFVFQLAYVNSNGASEYCEVLRSGSSAGGYAGTRFYKASKDAQVQPDGQCRVLTGSAGGSVQTGTTQAGTVWPPSNLLREGVTVRVEARQVWTGSIAGKDGQGDWTGRLTGANGARGSVFAYMNDNGTFEFQIAYTPSGVTQYEYCTLEKNGSQVAPGVYVGKRYFAANKDAKIEPDGDCRVVIGATSSQVSPQPQPNPPPQQASGPALPWPSNITVGQTWRVVITGAQATTFTLNLTGLDEFETPSGRLGAQIISMFPSRSQEATVIEIIGQPGAPIISCTFKGASSVRGSTLIGGKVQTRVNRGALPVEQPGTCEATLVSGGSGAAVAPVAPSDVTPAANPQTSTPPVTTAWPLKLGVGQSWRAEIQGIGSWNVTFKILDRDGYPQGSAVPSGSGGALEAAFFYFQNDNDMRLKLTSGNTLYRCIFERNEIGGLTFSGWRYVDSADGKSLDKTAQRCNMTFIGRVTLSSLIDPLAGFAAGLAGSHSSN